MKSPQERQRAYRERRKERKNAGLTKLKILANAMTGKKLEILSVIDNTDVGNVLGQAVELLWTQRFGNAGGVAAESEAEKAANPEKAKKKTAKVERSKVKLRKSGHKIESGHPIAIAENQSAPTNSTLSARAPIN